QPSFDFGGKAQLTYGNYNQVQARGYVTGPIIDDQVAGNISFSYNYRDNYVKNVTIGGKTAGVNQPDGRAQLLWNAASNLEVLLGADVLYDSSPGYSTKVFGNFIPVEFPTINFGSNRTNQAFNGFNHRDIFGLLGRVTWTNDWGVLTSITGYRNV